MLIRGLCQHVTLFLKQDMLRHNLVYFEEFTFLHALHRKLLLTLYLLISYLDYYLDHVVRLCQGLYLSLCHFRGSVMVVCHSCLQGHVYHEDQSNFLDQSYFLNQSYFFKTLDYLNLLYRLEYSGLSKGPKFPKFAQFG